MATRRAASGDLEGQTPSKRRKATSLVPKSTSTEPDQENTESLLLKLSDELLEVGAGFVPRRSNENHNLVNLMLTCRKLYDVSCKPAYEIIHCSAPRTISREFANVELLFRSLIRKQVLGKYVKKISIDNKPWSGRWADQKRPTLFACIPDGFLNRSDLKLVYEFLSAICNLPIYDEFPAGRLLKTDLLELGRAGLLQSENLNAHTPINRIRKHMITQSYEGRQDAVVGAMLYFFSNLEHLDINDFDEIVTQYGEDALDSRQQLGPHDGQRGIGDSDCDYISRTLRGALNSQLLPDSLPANEWGFNGRLLLKLKTFVSKPAPGRRPMGTQWRRQTMDRAVNSTALPSIEQANLCIFEEANGRPHTRPPSQFGLNFNIRKLILQDCHVSAASLRSLLDLLNKLEHFTYSNRFLIRRQRTWRYNHVHLIKYLQRTRPKMRRLIMGNIYDSEPQHTDQREAFAHIEFAKISTWQPFYMLETLIIPTEYVLGWTVDDMEYFDRADDPDFDISLLVPAINRDPVTLLCPFHEQLPKTLKTLGLTSVRHHPRYDQLWTILRDVLRQGRHGGRRPKLDKLLLGTQKGPVFPQTLERQHVALLVTARNENIKVYASKPGKGDVLVRLGEEAHLSEDMIQMTMHTDYPDSEDEEREGMSITPLFNNMPSTYHEKTPQGICFATIDPRLQEIEEAEDDETEDPTYLAPEVEEEIRRENPRGVTGRPEYWKTKDPDPVKTNVYHRGLKEALKQELWHWAHHYHDGLDGDYLNLPRSEEAF